MRLIKLALTNGSTEACKAERRDGALRLDGATVHSHLSLVFGKELKQKVLEDEGFFTLWLNLFFFIVS